MITLMRTIIPTVNIATRTHMIIVMNIPKRTRTADQRTRTCRQALMVPR